MARTSTDLQKQCDGINEDLQEKPEEQQRGLGEWLEGLGGRAGGLNKPSEESKEISKTPERQSGGLVKRPGGSGIQRGVSSEFLDESEDRLVKQPVTLVDMSKGSDSHPEHFSKGPSKMEGASNFKGPLRKDKGRSDKLRRREKSMQEDRELMRLFNLMKTTKEYSEVLEQAGTSKEGGSSSDNRDGSSEDRERSSDSWGSFSKTWDDDSSFWDDSSEDLDDSPVDLDDPSNEQKESANEKKDSAKEREETLKELERHLLEPTKAMEGWNGSNESWPKISEDLEKLLGEKVEINEDQTPQQNESQEPLQITEEHLRVLDEESLKSLEFMFTETLRFNPQWTNESLAKEFIHTSNAEVAVRYKEEMKKPKTHPQDLRYYMGESSETTTSEECLPNPVWEDEDCASASTKRMQSTVYPIKINKNEQLGRFLVSTRRIEAGEVILLEKSLSHGPIVTRCMDKIKPRCVHCYAVSCNFICQNCGFFVCRSICSVQHDSNNECSYLRRWELYLEQQHIQNLEQRNFRPLLEVLPPEERESAATMVADIFSSFLQKQKTRIMRYFPALPTLKTIRNALRSKIIYSFIQSLQSTVEPESRRYAYNDKWVVEPILRLNLPVTKEEIHKIASIWDNNAFQVTNEKASQAIYGLSSFFTHSCVPNCEHSFTGDGTIIVRAVDDIPSKTILTLSYTDLLWPTFMRKDNLHRTKHFLCTCSRCLDDTEFGTKVGYVRCEFCEQLSICPKFLEKMQETAKCDICGNEVMVLELVKDEAKLLSHIKFEPLRTLKDHDNILAFLEMSSPNRYHEFNHLVQRMNLILLIKISHISSLGSFTLEDLKKLERIARVSYNFCSKIFAPYSLHKAKVIREWHRYKQEICLRTLSVFNIFDVVPKHVFQKSHLILKWHDKEPPMSFVLSVPPPQPPEEDWTVPVM